MGRLLIYPYKLFSTSAKKLANALGSRRIKPHGRYRSLWTDTIINWGNSTIPTWYGRILNNPEDVAHATNKLKTFEKLNQSGVSIPEYCTDKSIAEGWAREGHTVYCRTELQGHSGSGIVLCTSPDEIAIGRLYTKRVKAKTEFRVHIFWGSVLDFQQKKRRNGVEHNHLIRNHRNGYVYARSDVNLPDDVREQAINAVRALNLDFGAVDIGYVERENKAYVYEVNTAPGLESSTLDKYVAKFKEILNATR